MKNLFFTGDCEGEGTQPIFPWDLERHVAILQDTTRSTRFSMVLAMWITGFLGIGLIIGIALSAHYQIVIPKRNYQQALLDYNMTYKGTCFAVRNSRSFCFFFQLLTNEISNNRTQFHNQVRSVAANRINVHLVTGKKLVSCIFSFLSRQHLIEVTSVRE